MGSNNTPLPPLGPVSLLDRQQLPGMLPAEIAIFKAWWVDNGQDYTRADFNVRVGHGVDPGTAYDTATRQAAILNSKYRIDAILWQGLQPAIMEVKQRASLQSIGQLLGYRELWIRDANFAGQVFLMLLCAQTNADTVYVAGKYGIAVLVQPVDLTGIPVLRS